MLLLLSATTVHTATKAGEAYKLVVLNRKHKEKNSLQLGHIAQNETLIFYNMSIYVKELRIALYLEERQTKPHMYVLYATINSKSVAADCVSVRELKLLRITLIPSPRQFLIYLIHFG